jgi:hypothetical protein
LLQQRVKQRGSAKSSVRWGTDMRYRDARLLHNEDEVIRKSDKVVLIVKEVECFGQYKKVKLACVTQDNTRVIVYNDEIE